MKWKITLAVAIVVGAIGGSWIKNLPGFVIIAYEKTTYEMRLWVAVTIVLILLSILFFIGVFIRSLLSGAARMKGWQGGRQWRKARRQTIKGMLAFVEGRWKQAEKTMIGAVKNSDTKLINYLIAAQSAQKQDQEERRDTYLRLAHQAEPNAKVAIGLTQARLQLEGGQDELALATLNDLRIKNPNHPFILKLLFKAHRNLQEWNSIIELLPQLKKYKVLDIDDLAEIETLSIKNMLKTESSQGSLESLTKFWNELSSASKKKPENIYYYAKLLVDFEQMDDAEKIVKPLFKKLPTDETIQLYGEIRSRDGVKQFNFLENWFNNHPEAPNSTYLALGKIAFHISLWGKARFYLERSLRQEPSAETFFMMAKTLQELDDEELSMDTYKKGLEFVVGPVKKNEPLVIADDSKSAVQSNILPKFENSSQISDTSQSSGTSQRSK